MKNNIINENELLFINNIIELYALLFIFFKDILLKIYFSLLHILSYYLHISFYDIFYLDLLDTSVISNITKNKLT